MAANKKPINKTDSAQSKAARSVSVPPAQAAPNSCSESSATARAQPKAASFTAHGFKQGSCFDSGQSSAASSVQNNNEDSGLEPQTSPQNSLRNDPDNRASSDKGNGENNGGDNGRHDNGRCDDGRGAKHNGTKLCRSQLASEGMRAAVSALANRMTSSWTRRGHNLLEISCADGFYLEMFWQSGFDVTGQEESPELLAQARERMRNAAEFVQINPERLPFDDHSFDYVVCLGGIECADDPAAVVREMFRVATRGVLLSFPCAWSLFALGSRFSQRGRKRKFFSPLQIASLLSGAEESSRGKHHWAGTLIGPAWSWKVQQLQSLNCSVLPLPLGAVSIVRVNFNPPLGVSPLLLSTKSSFKQESVAGGLGQVNKLKP